MKLTATIEVEFEGLEGQPENALVSALRRGEGALRLAIEHGVTGGGSTGIRKGSTQLKVTHKITP